MRKREAGTEPILISGTEAEPPAFSGRSSAQKSSGRAEYEASQPAEEFVVSGFQVIKDALSQEQLSA